MTTLEDAFHEHHYGLPLETRHIHKEFIRPMQSKLGCQHFSFPACTFGMQIFPDLSTTEKDKSQRLVDCHTDGLNTNDISLVYHRFMKFEDHEKKSFVVRFFLIPYTRNSVENFMDNESRLDPLKDVVLSHVTKVTGFLEDNDFFGVAVKAKRLDQIKDIVISDKIPFDEQTLKGKDGSNNTIRYYRIPATCFREVTVSSAITVLRKIFKKYNGNVDLFLGMLLLASYQASYEKLYYAAKDILEDPQTDWSVDQAMTLARLMDRKCGNWKGTFRGRGHLTRIDFLTLYKDEDVYRDATNALKEYLVAVDSDPDLTLPGFKCLVDRFVSEVQGIKGFYGQRIPLLAAGCSAIVTTNIRNATLAYPVKDGGATYNTILEYGAEQENAQAEGDMDGFTELMETSKLDPSIEKFPKASRLICRFAGLNDHRLDCGENLYCEGVGRKGEIHDYVFPGQCMYSLRPTNPNSLTSPLVLWEKKPLIGNQSRSNYRPIYDWQD